MLYLFNLALLSTQLRSILVAGAHLSLVHIILLTPLSHLIPNMPCSDYDTYLVRYGLGGFFIWRGEKQCCLRKREKLEEDTIQQKKTF